MPRLQYPRCKSRAYIEMGYSDRAMHSCAARYLARQSYVLQSVK